MFKRAMTLFVAAFGFHLVDAAPKRLKGRIHVSGNNPHVARSKLALKELALSYRRLWRVRI